MAGTLVHTRLVHKTGPGRLAAQSICFCFSFAFATSEISGKMARTAAFAFIALLLVGSAFAGAPAYDAPPVSPCFAVRSGFCYLIAAGGTMSRPGVAVHACTQLWGWLLSQACLLACLVWSCSSVLICIVTTASTNLQPGTNCNRSCWKAPNLFGLKNTLFRLCKAKVSAEHSWVLQCL